MPRPTSAVTTPLRRAARRALPRVNRVLRRTGLALVPHDPRDAPVPHDIDAATAETIRRVRHHTLTSHARVAALCEATRSLTRQCVPGAFVECGAWRGGSMMAVALTLLAEGDTSRDLYLFDTFTHMPPPGEADVRHDGVPASVFFDADIEVPEHFTHLSADAVRTAMVTTGYPAERIHLVEGLIEDTVPDRAPDEIALLRLDTDWYASTRHELEHLYPRVAPGGVLLIDDYGHYLGARRAVDEHFGTDRAEHFHRIDDSGRLVVKPAASS